MKCNGQERISDVVVVGNLAARVKDHNHEANGVATSTSLVGRRVQRNLITDTHKLSIAH